MKPRSLCTHQIAVAGAFTLLFAFAIDAIAESELGRQPLNSVAVTDLGSRIRVEIQGDRPILYAAATSPAPAMVTLALPEFSQGHALRRISVDQPPLLEVIPTDYPEPRSRLELAFRLAYPVDPIFKRDGNRLLVEFPKEGVEPVPSARSSDRSKASVSPVKGPQVLTPRVRPAPGPGSGEDAAGSRVMTKVEVERGHAQTSVTIFTSGQPHYEANMIDSGRLVVDLPGTSSALQRNVLPVNHPLLKRIRIGHHIDRLRLVFDLPQPVAYTLHNQGSQLRVQLEPTANGSVQPHPAVSSPEPERRSSQTVAVKRARPAGSTRPPATARAVRLVDGDPSKPRLAQMDIDDQLALSPSGAQKQFTGRRISLDFQGADISNVLRLIAEVSGFNIVIGEGVKAKVTMKLVNIPWDQALDMLLKMNNLGMVKEGNIIWIDTLTNIARQQDAEAKAQESKIKAEKLVTRIIYVQNVKADEIMATLGKHLSPRGQIQVNQATNALVLQETESKIDEFVQLVRRLDLVAPQVQIEARIVQADTSFSRSLGIQWGVRHRDFGGQKFTVVGNLTGPFGQPNVDGPPGSGAGTVDNFDRDFLVNLPAAVTGLSSVPGIGFTAGKLGDGFNIDLRLSAGELLGLTKVIAAPKITTLDKQQAKIEQGESIPFQTTSLQGTQTTFVDANLTLQVTPQITSRDPNEKAKHILMKVKATRNAVGARSNPAGPSIDKREATTQVLVRDGETMVIGGIFVDTQNNSVGGVPYLSRIPVLGWLFKNKTETVAKQELLIFLTPTIVS